MRNIKILILIWVSIFFVAKTFSENKEDKDKFYWNSYLRTRNETVDWFGNQEQNNSHLFHSLKYQFGIGFEEESYKIYLQDQISSLFSAPYNALGIGAQYRSANDDEASRTGNRIREFNVLFKNLVTANNSLKLGRMLYSSGEENLHEDLNVKWLQSKRIGSRLIGNTDYSFGRSFDGIRTDSKLTKENSITLFLAHPNEGGSLAVGNSTIEHIDIGALTFTNNIDHQENQLFLYFYRDDRNILKSDNRELSIRDNDRENISLLTYGGSSAYYHEFQNIGVDAILWGVLQNGDWGMQTQNSYSYVAETGLHFNTYTWKPAFRVGTTLGSGDTDLNDNKHNTFFQMEPTSRSYALIPFYNMQNIQDSYLQLIFTPNEYMTLKSELHQLHLAEAQDLLYSGSGATDDANRFGYSGLSLKQSSEVGTVGDIEFSYILNKYITLNLYYGILFGGEGISNLYPLAHNDIHYGFAELGIRF